MATLDYKEILVKRPFYEITPKGYMQHGPYTREVDEQDVQSTPDDTIYRNIKTQADFLREYYPSGHRIWDSEAYPDIWKKDPDSGKWYQQPVSRTAFAFQQVIATKHTLHLTGNDIQFELADGNQSLSVEDNQQETLVTFKKGWLLANMEVVHYEAVDSYMTTAEAAVVGYFANGKFGAKSLSFKNGDYLYPHINSITGEMEVFARKYYDYDEDGHACIEWVEVWDDTYLYRYKNDLSPAEGVAERVMTKIKDIFGVGGYQLVSQQKHGFPFIPVAYKRNDDGPCWSNVQKNIEDYEEAFSYLCENNKAYAFPIFYVKGDGEDINIIGDDMTGAVKTIAMSDTDNDAGFLNGTDASDAFATQLNKSYDLIYELSFTVKPPELKSGDLPGVAIKLLYSPALEVAMNDAQKLQPFLDQLVKIAKYGVGMENNMTATMMNLNLNAWVQPYIHSNSTEIITNLATAVQNKFISKQTASERCPEFPKNNEFERIMREQKEEDQQDLLMDLERQDNELQNTIKQEEAEARINKQNSGQDINTGHGQKGRPNKSGKQWDENGNNAIDDANNWEQYDKKH
jgi:hypothetical protein